MTEETNAAIEGALEAGATEILVNDSHDAMRNIILEDLNPEARLITGDRKPMSMMEGMGPGFDARDVRGISLSGCVDRSP
jgi:D-amino peptidase